ncbi:MAG TPA: SDR family NAD(P)-dependent oxidoreductase, partial [Myxococcota bacterium]|nr:SDR family NAD(P)-dependent oxidoreductase [Myxococcota bacterium]
MREWVRHQVARRPWWMNGLLLFSAFMAFIYVPWDFSMKPVRYDAEVWFGVRFHGWWAKLLEPPHWLVYGLGTYGFWRMSAWMWPWSALYAAQVSFSMLVWPLLYRRETTSIVLGGIGALAFAAIARELWQAREAFQPPRRSLRERYGEWAVITGASSGIGAEFSRALARDGVSLVLAARRADKLEALAKELREETGVRVRCVACDLASEAGVRALLEACADLEIALLVNNAGAGYVGRFHEQEPARLAAMVQLNCAAPVALTAALLPKLVARKRGAVIFTGSVSGSQPLPLHSLYSATKAFDNFLGESLWGELQGTGVDVLSLLPGSTETEFAARADELPHAGATAAEVVADALAAL